METKNQDLRILYARFLRNELSAEEIRQLLPKLAAKPDSELHSLLSEFISGSEMPVPGEEESLSRIFASIKTKHLSSPVKSGLQKKLYQRIAAAAAIILIAGLGIYLYLQSTNSFQQIQIAAGSTDIIPGKDRAILKLSNGTEIDLAELGKGRKEITDQHGVRITREQDGQLVYQVLGDLETSARTDYNTISTPRGGKYKIILPDSTQVWLNASSSITYPTSFAHADSRLVKLKGEAYFEVHKQPLGEGKAQPFVVSAQNQEIRVLGTHFNVNAYPDEPSARTTLLEGSVQLNGNTMLRPGQQGITENGLTSVQLVNAPDFIDWKTGEFSLKNTDFRTIMRKISRWYDVEVVYDDSAPDQVKLGGWISREKNISSVLNLIQKTGNIHFKIEGRRVTVSK